ncbi:hypothetical protein [Streptomyces sp. AA1529]|uniref:hypothetical protein n=1 Tax=Streptomyces sp. AA1529 TaxID=1203257 RepID=UPI000309DF9F|nr:hypothetical protein [Streptomyces sp. AA1529]
MTDNTPAVRPTRPQGSPTGGPATPSPADTESEPQEGAQDREAIESAYLRAVVLSALAGCGVQVPDARAQAAAETVLVHLADAQQPGGGAVRVTTGSSERRERYAAAMHRNRTGSFGPSWPRVSPDVRAMWLLRADAAMAVADAEQHAVYRLLAESRTREARLREELTHWRRVAEQRARVIGGERAADTELRGERDRAREVAVRLENQLAAIRGLHQPKRFTTSDICGHCSGWGGDGTWPAHLIAWPCDTVRALEEQP